MAENEIAPVGSSEVKTKEAEVPFHMQQRNALGIPPELKNKPVLYMSSHRGAFDVRHKGHEAAFQKIVRGEGQKAVDEEREDAFLDLKKSPQDEILGTLKTFVERAVSPVQETNMLPSPGSENMVPPGFITNVIYLPPLDENYDAIGCESKTISFDGGNYQHMLKKLKEILIEQKVIKPIDKIPEEDVKRLTQQES